MAYIITDVILGNQNIADTSSTAKHPLGLVVSAVDPTLGGGEFVYLKGVASTIVGSVVTWDGVFQTALAPVGANLPQAVAVAMSANVAAQFGWYQVAGQAQAAKATTVSFAANAAIGVKTVGLVNSSGTGKEVQGALVAVAVTAASAVGLVQIKLNRPHMQGRVS